MMEFYKNEYTSSGGKLKGLTDDEYYAIREKKVLCIYVAQVSADVEVQLSIWDSSWKFGERTSKAKFEKAFIKSVFSGQVKQRMIDFYFEGKE